MTQLLIQGEVILAQDVTETASSIISSDAIYPKHVVEGWQIVEADVPDGFVPSAYRWNGTGVEVKPPVVIPPTKEEIQAEIDRLERDSLMNRGTRELSLVSMSDLATRKAEKMKEADPTETRTVEELATLILLGNTAYVKFKELDDKVSALRAQL
jgi:hypothetical protein